MKEKNLERKQALKKARDKVKRKKSLRHAISIFLVKYVGRTTAEPYFEFTRMLQDGFKGYDKMRSRELIKNFEHAYATIRNPEKRESLELALENSWGHRTRQMMELYQERNIQNIVEELVLESDALMNGLLELAFDLDVEE